MGDRTDKEVAEIRRSVLEGHMARESKDDQERRNQRKLEVWKPIPGTKDLFEVSSKGRVRRCSGSGNSKEYHVLWLQRTHDGYLRVHFTRGLVPRVHRLVACTFLGEPVGDRNVVNHKNGHRSDNHVENLEWVTTYENLLHSYEIGSRERVLTDKQIRNIRKLHAIQWTDIEGFAWAYGTSESTIEGIVKGLTWKHVK